MLYPQKEEVWPKSTEEITPDLPEELKINDFQYCYRYARSAIEENFVEENFSTINDKNLSHYNFYKNTDSLQVHETFQLELIKQFYPSQNLQELKLFSSQLECQKLQKVRDI